MGFKMGGIDHQLVRFTGLPRQSGEYTVEHAKSAPAHKPIVKRLVRTVTWRCILPLKAMLYNVNNPAYDPKIIHARHTVR